MYSTTLNDSTRQRFSDQHHTTAALHQRNNNVPKNKEDGWVLQLVCMVLEKTKYPAHTGIETWSAWPIASCYTDYTIPAPNTDSTIVKI